MNIESWEQEREASLRKPLPIDALRAMCGLARLFAWEVSLENPAEAAEWLIFSLLVEKGFWA